eukprot:1354742-Heterocapsa_arctica.AAC.1
MPRAVFGSDHEQQGVTTNNSLAEQVHGAVHELGEVVLRGVLAAAVDAENAVHGYELGDVEHRLLLPFGARKPRGCGAQRRARVVVTPMRRGAAALIVHDGATEVRQQRARTRDRNEVVHVAPLPGFDGDALHVRGEHVEVALRLLEYLQLADLHVPVGGSGVLN